MLGYVFPALIYFKCYEAELAVAWAEAFGSDVRPCCSVGLGLSLSLISSGVSGSRGRGSAAYTGEPTSHQRVRSDSLEHQRNGEGDDDYGGDDTTNPLGDLQVVEFNIHHQHHHQQQQYSSAMDGSMSGGFMETIIDNTGDDADRENHTGTCNSTGSSSAPGAWTTSKPFYFSASPSKGSPHRPLSGVSRWIHACGQWGCVKRLQRMRRLSRFFLPAFMVVFGLMALIIGVTTVIYNIIEPTR